MRWTAVSAAVVVVAIGAAATAGALLRGAGLALAPRTAPGSNAATGAAHAFVGTVGCDQFIGMAKTGRDGGNRVVLGIVSAPPAYLPQVVLDPASAPFPYWRKTGMVIRASTSAVTVSVPRAWRDRVRITWGREWGTAMRFAPCPARKKTWNAYAGGFLLRERSACVPLVFAVGRRHAVLRFGVGRRC